MAFAATTANPASMLTMKLLSGLLLALLTNGAARAEPAIGRPSTDPNPIVRIEGDTLT